MMSTPARQRQAAQGRRRDDHTRGMGAPHEILLTPSSASLNWIRFEGRAPCASGALAALSAPGGVAPPGRLPRRGEARAKAISVKLTRASPAGACQKSGDGQFERRKRSEKTGAPMGSEIMTANRKTAGVRAALAGTALCALVACSLWVAEARAQMHHISRA
jgi:hypothetical protein